MNDVDAFPKQLPEDHLPYFYKRCLVERVYDGDTITVTIDHGFGLKVDTIELRLYGLNTPEVKGSSKPQGIISRDWLRERIAPNATKFSRWGWITDGSLNYIDLQTIKVGTKNQAKGKYGRYLAVLWHEDGLNVNWQLIDNKLAAIANY
jgi:micrococcal nuclease